MGKSMKIFSKLGLGLIVLMMFASVQAADLTEAETVKIKADIKQLVDNYAITRDNWDAKGHANLFTEQAKLIMNGAVTQGPEAIQKRIEGLNHNGRSLHMMTSSQITIIDKNTATGIQYVAVYTNTPEQPVKEEESIAVKGPSRMGKYFDKYERTADGWKIAERRLQTVFTTAE
jgi:hypothetical protein